MKQVLRATTLGLILLIAAGVAAAQDWATYDAEEYGFSMLMPVGTKFVEREDAGGWGQLWAEHEGVKVYVLAKLGERATAEEIEKVGVKLTGIPGSYWKTINKGENENGWIWYRTVEAVKGGKLILGDYGTGKRGSYLIIIETTVADYEEYEADYRAWYQSIRLH